MHILTPSLSPSLHIITSSPSQPLPLPSLYTKIPSAFPHILHYIKTLGVRALLLLHLLLRKFRRYLKLRRLQKLGCLRVLKTHRKGCRGVEVVTGMIGSDERPRAGWECICVLHIFYAYSHTPLLTPFPTPVPSVPPY